MAKTTTSNAINDFQSFLPGANHAITHPKQNVLAADFLRHFFSPWVGPRLSLLEPENIRQIHQTVLEQFQSRDSIGPNKQPYSKSWWRSLEDNCQLSQFPSLNKPAITLNDVQSRLLPADAPVFKQWTAENTNGYPFDRLQQSLIPANTPIHVLHISKDGAWLLITTPSFFAWIRKAEAAWVSASFIEQWQTANYAVASQDCVVANHDLKLPSLALRIGQLYPVQKKMPDISQLLVASQSASRQAVIKTLDCPSHYLEDFPMKITASNIARVAAQMLGNPYGWGGMYGHRDCSATVMDLLANFGLWLPRNSQDQANLLAGIDLSGRTPEEKFTLINQHALAFLTLIHFPGHVGLYLGNLNNEPYFFHNGWGASGTVIMSLNEEERPGFSFLSSADKLMSLL